MTTSLDERPFSPDTRKNVMISTFVGCLGVLLVAFAMTLAQHNKPAAQPSTADTCAWLLQAHEKGLVTRQYDTTHWYARHC